MALEKARGQAWADPGLRSVWFPEDPNVGSGDIFASFLEIGFWKVRKRDWGKGLWLNAFLCHPALSGFPSCILAESTLSPSNTYGFMTLDCTPIVHSWDIHWGCTDEIHTHLVLQELTVPFFAIYITTCEKSPLQFADIGKINKFWGWRGTGIFLALLWLHVVPRSLSLLPLWYLVVGKFFVLGNDIIFFFKESVQVSSSKVTWLYDLN